nr:RecName: Full=Allergen Act d 13; AltName: Allergen=Act d 13 [Actinidia deliciosa]
GPQQQHRL